MRTKLTAFLGLLVIHFVQSDVCAAPSDLEIHCAPKKTDANGKQTARAGHVTRKKEHWSYDVTVENKTFKELSGLEMKYVIFFKVEKLAARDAATSRRQSGSLTIESLKPHEKKSFTTDSVELDSARLASNYYYADGGRQKAQDTLGGLWVRVYRNPAAIGVCQSLQPNEGELGVTFQAFPTRHSGGCKARRKNLKH